MAGPIAVIHRGSFKKTAKFLGVMAKGDLYDNLESLALQGVSALAAYTPLDTGISADSWDYEISADKGEYSITWTNHNTVQGTPVVIWLQYGHGTGTGGYVQGRDFINPAIEPTFNRIADAVWKAVISA